MDINAIIQRLKNRADSEHEQALARIIISSAVLAYLLYTYFTSAVTALPMQVLVVAPLFVAGSCVLFITIVIWPGISLLRRAIAMGMDFSALTYSMLATGEVGAAIFSIYLWVTVGYGMRYGLRYLYVSTVLANSSFLFVMFTSPYWIEHRTIATGLFLGLVALPVFFSSLLRRLGRSNEKLKKLSEEMTRLAMHDSVTGLPNRVLLQERLDRAICVCRRHQSALAVLFVDLDGFKAVNDQWGHKVGDELLRICGRRLAGAVRETDTVARLGGDEFVLLLSEIRVPDDAMLVAGKILVQLRVPVQIDRQELSVGASIGIAVYPADGENTDALIKSADQAMYVAKRSGKNTATFNTARDEARLSRGD